MKIIIVGSGISGLSAYLHLRKHLPHPENHSITMYESHRPRSKLLSSGFKAPHNLNLESLSESTAVVGGGLGISPNGMRVLRDLDTELYDRVVAQGFPTEKFIFKGANGWILGAQPTSDKSIRAEGEPAEVCIASSRHGLWKTLMQSIGEEEGEEVIKYRKVVGIERDEESGKIVVRSVELEGQYLEEIEETDLLIGADGVKSVVRTALFGEEECKPTYTGLSGVGGFIATPLPPFITTNKAMVFTFGGNGFFGYSSGGPPSSNQLMWWSTFETSSLPDSKNIDPLAVQSALLERHKSWRDPIVQEIIQKADVESIYPTWVLDELPHWGEKGIVLIGDAAHAMDPTTGQGASQALEDSQTFALLLAETLKAGGNAHSVAERQEKVNLAIKLLYEIRKPRVHEIVERGKKLSSRKANVGVVAEYFMYFFFWLMMKVPGIGKAILGDVNRKLYGWSAKDEVQRALEKNGPSALC